jgi:hypothetical protein
LFKEIHMRIVIEISDPFRPDGASVQAVPNAHVFGMTNVLQALDGGVAPGLHSAGAASVTPVAEAAVAATSINGGAYGGQLATSDYVAYAADVIDGGAAPA